MAPEGAAYSPGGGSRRHPPRQLMDQVAIATARGKETLAEGVDVAGGGEPPNSRGPCGVGVAHDPVVQALPLRVQLDLDPGGRAGGEMQAAVRVADPGASVVPATPD